MGNIFGLHQPVVDIDRWPDGGGVGKGGVGVSAIEGEKIGQTCIDKTVPFIFFADDLTDIGSTATKDYDTPQGRFEGNIAWCGRLQRRRGTGGGICRQSAKGTLL
jgi:hypothetical protein